MSMGLIGGGALKNLSLAARRNPCVKIMREFTIDYKGRVFPCCNIFPDLAENEKFVLGDVMKESIFEIFASKIWAKWRQTLFVKATQSPCSSCKDGFFDTDKFNENERKAILKDLI